MSEQLDFKKEKSSKRQKSDDRIRVQLDMSEESVNRLDAIAKQIPGSSRAHVVRISITILEALLKLGVGRGGVLYSEKDGERKEIIIPGLI